jgi:predicted ATPase
MGKSSCIQSLLLLRQSFQLGHLDSKGGLFLAGEYSKPGNGKDVFFQGAEASEKILIAISFSGNLKSSFEFTYEKDSDLQPTSGINATFDLTQANLFNDNFFYLNADRLSPDRDVFPASESNIQKGNLGKHGQFAVHFICKNQRKPIGVSNLKHHKAATDTLLDNIDAWLREVTPGIKVAAQFYPEINSARLAYQFDTEGGVSDEFKPSNVGYGITYILPVIVQILIARPGQSVIIENPESHLHPTGQAAIARLCILAAQNGIQIILETHSDHIVNAILIGIKNYSSEGEGIELAKVCIQFVDREDNKGNSRSQIIKIESDGRILNAPENFFDQFAKDMKAIMGF